MKDIIPQQCGHLAKDSQGNLVLINPAGKAYAVDHDISAVWSMLDGTRDYQEILHTLSSDSPYGAQEIDHTVREVLERLHAVDLVRW